MQAVKLYVLVVVAVIVVVETDFAVTVVIMK